jgi:hypothetical protein
MKKLGLIIAALALLLAAKAEAAFPTTFATLAGGNQPLSLLDTMFGVVGNMAQVMCTATGTNTIALTPITNMPTQGAYQNYQEYGFVAAATSTSSVTINVSGVGALPLYLNDGATQASTNSLLINAYYLIIYNSALNSGGGGFQLVGGDNSSLLNSPNTWNGLNTFTAGLASTSTPATAPQFDTSGTATLSIANGASAAITPNSSGYYSITVAETLRTGQMATYLCGTTVCALGNTLGVDWVASTQSPASGKFSIDSGGGSFNIYNNYGNSGTFAVTVTRLN